MVVKSTVVWSRIADGPLEGMFIESQYESARHLRMAAAKNMEPPDGYKFLGVKNSDGEWVS